jgi:hypothetical protein
VLLTSSYTWGSRIVQNERVIKERTAIEQISEEDLFQALFEEIRGFLA